MSLFRTRVVGLTRLVLLALAISLVPHIDAADHDTDGDFFAVVHDHAAHRLSDGSQPTADGPTHCAICHVGQSFRVTPWSQGAQAPASTRAVAAIGYQSIAARRVAFSFPPLRSPPDSVAFS